MFKRVVILLLFLLLEIFVVNTKAIEVFVYLNLKNYKNIKGWIKFEEVYIKRGKFNYVLGKNFTIKIVSPGQYFLGSTELSSGSAKLVFKIKSLYFSKKLKKFSNLLEIPLVIKKSKNPILIFTELDLERSFKNGCFCPVFTVKNLIQKKGIQLVVALDKYNQGLWIINSVSNRVVSFKKLNCSPEYMEKGLDNNVYVICKNKLEVLNYPDFQLENLIPIGSGNEFNYLVLGEDRLLLISYEDQKIVMLDLKNGEVIGEKFFMQIPISAAYVPKLKGFLVGTQDGKVHFFNISLEKLGEVSLAGIPEVILGYKDKVFIGDNQGWITIYKIPSFQRIGKLKVCDFVEDLKLCKDKVVVSCNDGEVAYFYPEELQIVDSILTNFSLGRLAFNPYQNLIYVVTKGKKSKILIIDNFNFKKEGEIYLGGPIDEIVSLP